MRLTLIPGADLDLTQDVLDTFDHEGRAGFAMPLCAMDVEVHVRAGTCQCG